MIDTHVVGEKFRMHGTQVYLSIPPADFPGTGRAEGKSGSCTLVSFPFKLVSSLLHKKKFTLYYNANHCFIYSLNPGGAGG